MGLCTEEQCQSAGRSRIGAAFPGMPAPAAACGSQALSSPENPEPNTFGGGKEFQCVTRASFQSQTAAQGTGHFSKGWKLDCLLKEDGCSLQGYRALAVLPPRDCSYLCPCRAFRDL